MTAIEFDKSFDCVEMKRKAQAEIMEKLAGMTEDEELEYWRRRREELLAKQAEARKKHDGDES